MSSAVTVWLPSGLKLKSFGADQADSREDIVVTISFREAGRWQEIDAELAIGAWAAGLAQLVATRAAATGRVI